MPDKAKQKTDFGPRTFSFARGASLTAAYPHIRMSECGIITADRPEFSPSENAERSGVLLANLLSAFFRAKEACIFELRLNSKNGQSPDHYGPKFFFICERQIYKQKSTYSPLFFRLAELAKLFQRQSFIHIPYREMDEIAHAERAKRAASDSKTGYVLSDLGIVHFKKNPEQIELWDGESCVTFDVTSRAHVVTGSMFMAAYKYRSLSQRDFPGKPKPPPRPKQRARHRPRNPFRWSGDCATKNIRYGSGNVFDASPDGGGQ